MKHLISLMSLVFLTALALCQTTAFTFQGQLKDGGSPANGSYNLVFKLFDAATAGTQIGSTVTINSQPVTNGLFTSSLDFGASVFNGADRWMEIHVITNGGATDTTLSPRMPITPTPYALYAQYAVPQGPAGGDLTGNFPYPTIPYNPTLLNKVSGGAMTSNGTFVGIGPGVYGIGSANFVVHQNTNGYGGMYVNTSGSAGWPFYGYSQNGSVPAFHFIDGSDGNKWKLYNGGATLTFTQSGRLGVGTISPVYALDVHSLDTSTSSAAITGTLDSTTPGASSSGVSGINHGTGYFGVGVTGYQYGYGWGIYGTIADTTNGYAGYFSGRLYAYSANSGIKAFMIDHPQDPLNKYLYHSSVESPDMMNIYNGTVLADAKGEATVELPTYFEALNKDFRYTLTCIGAFAPVYVAEEITNNRFKIAGAKPGMKISWQVTGIRHDAVANKDRIIVEKNKPDWERGKYLNPEAYGVPKEQGSGYIPPPDSKPVHK